MKALREKPLDVPQIAIVEVETTELPEEVLTNLERWTQSRRREERVVPDEDTAVRLATEAGYPSYWTERKGQFVFVKRW